MHPSDAPILKTAPVPLQARSALHFRPERRFFLLLPAIARSSANAPYQAHMKKPGKARLLMRFRQLTVVSCIPKVARCGSSNQPASITIWNPNFRKKQEFDVLRDVNKKLVTPIVRSNRFKHLIMTDKYYMPNLSKTAQFRHFTFAFLLIMVPF
jgi:hypothetical protein